MPGSHPQPGASAPLSEEEAQVWAAGHMATTPSWRSGPRATRRRAPAVPVPPSVRPSVLQPSSCSRGRARASGLCYALIIFLGLGEEQTFFQASRPPLGLPQWCWACPSILQACALSGIARKFPRVDSSFMLPFWLLLHMPHSFASPSGFHCTCLCRGISPPCLSPPP